MSTSKVVVLDNGGATIKAGYATSGVPEIFPNATAKVKGEKTVATAEQVAVLEDISALQLRRPIDRGYIVNWDLQKGIWDRAFRSVLQLASCRSAGLILTEPLFPLAAVQQATDQTVFEEFQFGSFLPLPAPLLSLSSIASQGPDGPAKQTLSGLVVDCGFSFTHVAPVFGGCVCQEGVKRINLGGKALTNYLKELVSFRSINMMEETCLVEHVKEASCFVSQDLAADLVAAKAGKHSRMFILPDGSSSNSRGYLRSPLGKDELRAAAKEGKETPALTLGNERFMVPELIFHPSDIGMNQAGLAQTLVQAADALHPDLRPLLLSNIVCTGGTAKCSGFTERLTREVRALVPAHYQVNVTSAQDPVTAAWHGGALLGRSPEYSRLAFTKAEYEERGSTNLRAQLEGVCIYGASARRVNRT